MIYFDGNLPNAKRDIRHARLAQSLHQLNHFRALCPDGLPKASGSPSNVFSDSIEMFSAKSIPARLKLLPSAPFVVPAVIEALLNTTYANCVYVVPGEADIYCAEDVKMNGGFVITGDSDLLVHDLGLGGGVVFFNDFSLGTHPPAISLLFYSQTFLRLFFSSH